MIDEKILARFKALLEPGDVVDSVESHLDGKGMTVVVSRPLFGSDDIGSVEQPLEEGITAKLQSARSVCRWVVKY